jgi:O-antigen/teichoic acid export membrane protein
LRANVVWNLAGYVAAMVTALLLAPFVIHRLGDSAYGVWVLASEIAGYSAVFDLGVRGAVDHYVARYSSTGESERLRRSLAAASWLLTLLGTAMLAAGLVLAVNFPSLFSTPGVGSNQIRVAAVLLAIAAGVGLRMDLYISILYGYRRLDLSNAAEIFPRVVAAVSTAAAVATGWGLIGVSVAHLAGRVCSWILRVQFVSRLQTGIPIRWRYRDKTAVRELLDYGGKALIVYIAWLLINRVDVLVVGATLGSAQVTFYSVGGSVVQYACAAVAAVAVSITPQLTRLHARGELLELRRIYVKSSRLASLAAAGLAALVLAFGPAFLSIWLGPKYVSGPWSMRSDVVMAILVMANLPRLFHAVSWQVLFAMRRVGFLMWVSTGEAIANLVLSLVLVRFWSLAGVALGTLIPMVIVSGIIVPVHVLRAIGVSWPDYLRECVARPLLTGVALYFVAAGLVALQHPDGWAQLIGETAVAGVAFAVIIYLAGLDDSERKQVAVWLRDRLL